MITGEVFEIGVDSEQTRPAFNTDPDLFRHFTRQGLFERLASFHAATRKQPARRIAVADKQHMSLLVPDDPAHPERQSARQAPEGLRDVAQDGAKRK